MRITLVTETFFPQVNGVSRTLDQLVRVLEAVGDTVQIIQPDYGEVVSNNRTRQLVRAVNPPFYRELNIPLPPFGPVRQALDAFRPDLVHIATEATLGLAVLKHARRRGLPVVSSFHTHFDRYTDYYRIGWMKGAVWRYLRWFHNRTRETFVPSNTTIHDLGRHGFERLTFWPRGVDSTLFRPDRPRREILRRTLGFGPNEIVIAHISRIAAEKNVAYLANALTRIEAARPEARVLIVGDGPERPKMELMLGTRARFIGYRYGEDLADHYAAADLFAFASRTETFGNVVLEAMAAGLPVVALRAGGPSEVVRNGETGFLIDPNEHPATFTQALLRLIGDGELRRRMAVSARDHALFQTWEAAMLELRSRYEMVLAAAKVAPP